MFHAMVLYANHVALCVRKSTVQANVAFHIGLVLIRLQVIISTNDEE